MNQTSAISITSKTTTGQLDGGAPDTDEFEAAFRALATFRCSVCQRTLCKANQLQTPFWYQHDPEKNDPHICCNTAHCPYCGRSAARRCRHLVAYREYGDWHVPGFRTDRRASAVRLSAPAHRIPDSQLIDFEEDQKQEAFRTAAPFLDLIYSEAFVSDPAAAVPLTAILAPHCIPAGRCLAANQKRRFNRYHFSKTPDAARIHGHQILHDLEEGINRMHAMTPSAARFLLREIEPVMPRLAAISAVQFSPDGRLLLIGVPGEGQLWDTQTGALLHRLRVGLPADANDFKNITAAFSPDGARLALAATSGGIGFGYAEDRIHKKVHTTTIFDVTSGAAIGTLDALALHAPITCNPTEALLASGTVMARIRGRFVHLAPIGPEGAASLGGARPVRLPHRTQVQRCTFSPDGRTFATRQADNNVIRNADRRILVWQLP